MAAHLAAGTCELLGLIHIFDAEEGWCFPGIASCAHWLNWKCSMSMGTARERVRVARALPALPKILAAFRIGKVSYSKVRAMTRVATRRNEDVLVNIHTEVDTLRADGCRFPGCSCSRFIDAHHIQHWVDGGETSMVNLVLLCRRHHRLVHEEGFGLDWGTDGAINFSLPDGTIIPPGPDMRFSGNVVALESGTRKRT